MIFFKSLRFKLIVFSLLLEIVMLSLLISNAMRLTEDHLVAQAKRQHIAINGYLKATLTPLLIARDYGAINSFLNELTQTKRIVYIYLEKEQKILASSKIELTKEKRPTLDSDLEYSKEIFNTKTEIEYLGQKYATVYYGIDTSFLSLAKYELFSQSLLIALFEVILSLILLLTIGYWLTKNLFALIGAAEKIANNDFDFKLNTKSKDEIGLLAKAFHKMSLQIKKQLKTIALQNKEQEKETKRLKAILENAGDYIHILDMDGNVFMFSDSFANSLGYTKEETARLNLRDWDLDFDAETIRRLIENPKTFETVHTRKDGSSFDVEVRTAGIELDDTIYLYAASRDITERKMAQEQIRNKDVLLQQQSRLAAMGEMIGNIAHQWRQPLSTISTIATSYKMRYELGVEVSRDDLLEEMANVNKNAQYLSQTIDDFRDFFREKRNKEYFNLKHTIEDSLHIIRAAYENYFIEIDVKLNKDIECFGAKSMLSQVILNILSNAKDALNERNIEDKHVIVQLNQTDLDAIILIWDNGGGVPNEIKNKIFDPYFTTKHQSKGTGLGLYMSVQIIKNHFNGSIEICNLENEYGLGACFSIKIPLFTPDTN